MKEIIKIFGDSNEIPSIINNPFLGEHIECIRMVTRRELFDRSKFETYATIEFKNGSTSGSQEIHASNLPELLTKVYEFCQSLK
jgi:hypothetical protein